MNKYLLPTSAGLLAAFGVSAFGASAAHAAGVNPPIVCGSLLPCFVGTGGIAGLDEYLTNKVFVILQVGFVALLILMLFSYAANLIGGSGDENKVSEAKLAYTYAIAGAAVVSCAMWIVSAFTPYNSAGIVNPIPIGSIYTNVYLYLRLALGTVLTANTVLQAFRLITSQGSDDLVGRARKRLLASFVGVGFVLLANTLVVIFNPAVGDADPGLIVTEIAGVANFLLTLLGGAAVIAIIVAGFLLVISVDEGLKEKAKQMVITSIIALAVALASFALVNAFILLDIHP
ncbi:MAG: hypothetical protein JWM56_1185 [Candidatus Peribacteria bacterium]|nr:hypothetical protein [Candidatus Peribacteria bacterium]